LLIDVLLFHSILTAKNEDGSQIELSTVETELLIILIAGSDTSAATLCQFLLNILQNPTIYQKMIDTEFSAENLALSEPSFVYTNAVIKETLRWSHPAPAFIPRIVSNKDGGGGPVILPDGRAVPAGVWINMNIHLVLRDRKIFGEDAEEFRPERWLEDPERAKIMDKYSIVWGYGSRVCPGRAIGEAELILIVREVRNPISQLYSKTSFLLN
jgi:cytochrome P450